jgi:hypothetical protein
MRSTYASSLPPSGCGDKARVDSESPTLRCRKFRQLNAEGRQMRVCGNHRGRSKTIKHVRTRLSALTIDIAFDIDSSHVTDIIFDHEDH